MDQKSNFGGARSRTLRRLLWFIFIVSSPGLRAESLEELLNHATKHDANFLAAVHNYKATTENPILAKAEFYPRVSFQADRSETRQDIIRADNPLFTGGKTSYPTDSYTLTIQQPLLNWQTYRRQDQADAEVSQARNELWEAQQSLSLRLSEAYFAVLSARSDLSLAGVERTVISKHLEQATEQHRLGFAAGPDVAEARARLSLVIAKEIEARNQLRDSVQALVEFANHRPASVLDLAENAALTRPSPNDVEWWVKEAIAVNPTLHARRYAVEVAKYEIKRRVAGDYPTLDLVARYGRRDAGGAMFGGEGTEVDTGELVLSLTVPIYQGQRVSAQVRQASELYHAAIAEEEQVERTVERRTRAAFLSIGAAADRASALQNAVEAQAIALEAKREGYKSGLYSSVDVLDAEQLLTQAKAEYQKARYEYCLNLLRLHEAQGGFNGVQKVSARLARNVPLDD